jgi:hypothetical protein
MKYLVSVLSDGSPELANPAEMAAIDAFNESVQAAGHWVFAGGLASPSASTVIDNRDGIALATEGPFTELREWIAGFWVFDAPDFDAALELAAAGSKACNRRVEVRPFLVR